MKRLLFSLFFFYVIISLNAQELFFSKPTAFQNLPSVETYQVFQDSKGYIWVTTDAGLCKYDGTTLKKYTVKDGISENVVLKVYEDSKGRVWFSTLSGSFFYYENNHFCQIAANEELKKKFPYPNVSFFIGDNDTLFFSDNSALTLIKIPPAENYKHIIKLANGSMKGYAYCYTDKKNKNKAVFGLGSGAAHSILDTLNCDGKLLSVKYKFLKARPSLQSEVGVVDKNGNIYFINQKKVIFYCKQTGKLEYYDIPYPAVNIYKDNDSDLWIATRQGGFFYKNSDLGKKPLTFLASLTISSFMTDRENAVWVTTIQKGVFKLNSKHFLLFPEKAIYFQKNSDQLTIACKEKKIVSIFKNDSFYVDNSFSKIILPEEEFRFASIDKEYSYFNTNYGSLLYKHNKDAEIHKANYLIASKEAFKNDGDTLYLMTGFRLSLIYKGKLIEVINLPCPANSLIQLKNKTILITSRNNNGAYELKGKSCYPYMPGMPQLKTRINCAIEDTTGNLWLATNEHGLYCLDAHKKLHVYDSLSSDRINSIIADGKSTIWAATHNELIKFDFSNGLEKPIISTFDQSNGLPDLQLSKLIAFNGYIWCSTNERFFCFKGNELISSKIPPLVYIYNITVNSKQIDDRGQLLKLKYNENNISILSTLIANKDPDKRKFMYKLEGYDNSWHFSSIGDIQYTNLDPGSYRFAIYGLSGDNIKSRQPATFSFIIAKPFWLTCWFMLIEAFAVVTASYFYFKYWRRKIEKREHDKTLINQKIAEFKMTALRAQMNPHFIFNAIGSIQHYILKNEVKQSYNYLSTFSMLIRNILNNSKEEYISLSQEINTLKLYIELEQIRFANPFKFIIEIDEQLDMETEIPTMLIQPYIENSIWHGLMPMESGGLLTLLVKKEMDSIHIIIRDNGVGRKLNDLPKKHVSKGMSITEQRIQTLEAINQRKMNIRIIDLKNESTGVTGTEVHLIIPID